MAKPASLLKRTVRNDLRECLWRGSSLIPETMTKRTRRSFIAQALAGFAIGVPEVPTAGRGSVAKSGVLKRQTMRIMWPKSAIRCDDNIIRNAVNGDICPLTWMKDDRQFCSFSDGMGCEPIVTANLYNTDAMFVEGDAKGSVFNRLSNYPSQILGNPERKAIYYGFSALAVADRIYQFLCFMKKLPTGGWGWGGVKVIYSADDGKTWRNQNGSTPVVWEDYSEQSAANMLFHDVPERAFSLVSLLQMGKNYERNRDGYVYGYGVNGNTDGTMNQLVMFRAPRDQVLIRDEYEFYEGIDSKGRVSWRRDIGARGIVHTFPTGWVNTPGEGQNVVQSWLPSVVYNRGLGVYMMASSGVGSESNGEWFDRSKPSYLGLWIACNPWGPWSQIHEDAKWTPGNDVAARCYSPQISDRWIAPDGRSFWLIWSDIQTMCDRTSIQRSASDLSDAAGSEEEKGRLLFRLFRRCAPYYSFNAQRYDIVL